MGWQKTNSNVTRPLTAKETKFSTASPYCTKLSSLSSKSTHSASASTPSSAELSTLSCSCTLHCSLPFHAYVIPAFSSSSTRSKKWTLFGSTATSVLYLTNKIQKKYFNTPTKEGKNTNKIQLHLYFFCILFVKYRTLTATSPTFRSTATTSYPKGTTSHSTETTSCTTATTGTQNWITIFQIFSWIVFSPRQHNVCSLADAPAVGSGAAPNFENAPKLCLIKASQKDKINGA